jgi:Ca2+-binding RTX toxin-like protein
MNIYGSAGTDFLYGTAGSDMLVGLGGADYLYGGDGEDLFIGGAGPDVMFGNSAYTRDSTDVDMAAYWDSPSSVTVDLTTGFGYGGTAEGDRLIDIEGVRGSEYGDLLRGNAQANNLDGGGGDDFLVGNDGDDTLTGGFGDDNLVPGSGVDFVNGGPGSNDTVDYFDSPSAVWVSLLFGGATGYAAGDTYFGVENLTGTDYGDYLQGDNEGNLLWGGRGNDWLLGEGGDDRLVGGRGIDTMVGGVGADTFIWTSTNETRATIADADLISDFDPTLDRIDLRQIDADMKMPGDQAFEFIGMADFTSPGQVRWSIEGSETIVWINSDWDMEADAAIRLAGAPLLGIDHFLL